MHCQLFDQIVLPDIVGWSVERVTPWDEDACEIKLLVCLHGPTAVWCKHLIVVNNTSADKISRAATFTGYYDLVKTEKVEMVGAFTALLNAWRSGETTEARQKALADELMELGIVDVSLAGTT